MVTSRFVKMTDKEINCFKENDQKQACSLEISGPGLIHVYICCHLQENSTNSDRSRNRDKVRLGSLHVRPVSCKCIKRNEWRPIGIHVNTPLQGEMKMKR